MAFAASSRHGLASGRASGRGCICRHNQTASPPWSTRLHTSQHQASAAASPNLLYNITGGSGFPRCGQGPRITAQHSVTTCPRAAAAAALVTVVARPMPAREVRCPPPLPSGGGQRGRSAAACAEHALEACVHRTRPPRGECLGADAAPPEHAGGSQRHRQCAIAVAGRGSCGVEVYVSGSSPWNACLTPPQQDAAPRT